MIGEIGYNYDIEFRYKVEAQILGLILASTTIYKNASVEDILEITEKHNLLVDDFRDDDNKDIYRSILACFSNGQEPTVIIVTSYRPEKFRRNNAGEFEKKLIMHQNTAVANVRSLSDLIFILKQFVLMDFWNKAGFNVLYGNWNGRDVIQVGDNIIADYELLMKRMTSKLKVIGQDDYTSEITEKVSKRNQGLATGVSTTVPCIDLFFHGYSPGELIIIAGRPGMGKTTFALISAWETYKLGNPVLFFSLEMPKNQLKSKIVSLETDIDYHRIKAGDLTPEELQNVLIVNRDIDNSKFFILDKVKTIEDIAEITVDYVKNHGVKIAFVDYIQRCKTRTGGKIREVITDITRELKSIAKESYIPVVALSQLSRAVEARINKRPILADLKESGSIEEDADIVAFLYCQAYYDKDQDMAITVQELFHTEFIIKKGRDLGTATLHIYLDAINMKIHDYRYDGVYDM